MSWDNTPYPHFCTKEDFFPVWIDKEETEYWCECEITNEHLTNILGVLHDARTNRKDWFDETQGGVKLNQMLRILKSRKDTGYWGKVDFSRIEE